MWLSGAGVADYAADAPRKEPNAASVPQKVDSQKSSTNKEDSHPLTLRTTVLSSPCPACPACPVLCVHAAGRLGTAWNVGRAPARPPANGFGSWKEDWKYSVACWWIVKLLFTLRLHDSCMVYLLCCQHQHCLWLDIMSWCGYTLSRIVLSSLPSLVLLMLWICLGPLYSKWTSL